MAYRVSRARKQFATEIRTIQSALREAHSSKCSSTRVREMALCSAVILCSAKLESYIEDLVSDWAKAVVAQGLTTDKLHNHTRSFLLNHPSVEAVYRRYLLDGDETELLKSLAGLFPSKHFSFAASGQAVPPFMAQRIYRDIKYPSPKNVVRLFNRCGIPVLFHALNSVAKKDVESLLISFNDIRTEMAHEGMPVGASAGDIKKHISNVIELVGYIDRIFYSHVAKTNGSSCWTT